MIILMDEFFRRIWKGLGGIAPHVLILLVNGVYPKNCTRKIVKSCFMFRQVFRVPQGLISSGETDTYILVRGEKEKSARKNTREK